MSAQLVMSISLEIFFQKSPFLHLLFLGLMDAHLSLQSHRFVMAMLPGLIPTPLVRLLPTLLLGHLVTLLYRLINAFLCWLLPTLGLRDIDTNLTRNGNAALLGYLLASLMWYILTLGVSDHGANFVRGCPAFGVRDLFAVLHWQFLALLPRHLLAHLVAGALLEGDISAHFFSLEMMLVVDNGCSMCLFEVDRMVLILRCVLLCTKPNGEASPKS